MAAESGRGEARALRGVFIDFVRILELKRLRESLDNFSTPAGIKLGPKSLARGLQTEAFPRQASTNTNTMKILDPRPSSKRHSTE